MVHSFAVDCLQIAIKILLSPATVIIINKLF